VTQLLRHTDQAELVARQVGNVAARAGAMSLAAYVHERFRGDVPTAIASLKAALILQPADPNIRETLNRLESSLAILQARSRVTR
jgi:hypothetical protein